MKYNFLLTLVIAISISVYGQESLTERLLLNGKVQISMPEQFTLMDDEMFRVKYPQRNRGTTEVFTDGAAEINVFVEHSSRPASKEALPQIEQSINNEFSRNPGIELINSIIKDINGQDFVVVEFRSVAIDTTVYNIMFVSYLEGRTLLGTFNCGIEHLPTWERIGKQIVNSVKVL